MRVGLACVLALFAATGVVGAQGVMVIGSQTHQVTLQPGGKQDGQIQVRNVTAAPRDVLVYATDYSFTADGRSSYGQPAGKASRSNASWIAFSPRQLTVSPGETATIYYSMQVPKDDSLKGTYWSMLMVEPQAPGVLTPPDSKGKQVSLGMRTVVRYGIQMITNIGDSGRRDLRFISKQLLAIKDQRLLQLDMENTGERALTPLLWAELYDSKGASLGRHEGGKLRLYPGCSGRFKIDLTKLPKGAYTALVVADNGDEHAFGTRLKLNIP